MLLYATPAITAEVDPYEERERDTLRSRARQQLSSPGQAGARIALAICEVEAGCAPRYSSSGYATSPFGPSCPSGCSGRVGRRCRSGAWSWWWPSSTSRGWPRSWCWCAGAGGWWRWRCGWTGLRATGSCSSSTTDHPARGLARAEGMGPRQASALAGVAPALSTISSSGVVAAARLAIVGPMSRTARLIERAITFALPKQTRIWPWPR
jgi:hypothetical protein